MKHLLAVTPSNLSLFPSCAICLDNFEASSDVKQLPTCHHAFHTTCLTEWLLRHGNCPMCRSVIASRHRTAVNDSWMHQMIFQSLRPSQESMNRIVVYPPIKAMTLPQITSNTITTNQTLGSSTDTPQLPHFDSQTQVHRTPSTGDTDEDSETGIGRSEWRFLFFLNVSRVHSVISVLRTHMHKQTKIKIHNSSDHGFRCSAAEKRDRSDDRDDGEYSNIYIYVYKPRKRMMTQKERTGDNEKQETVAAQRRRKRRRRTFAKIQDVRRTKIEFTSRERKTIE